MLPFYSNDDLINHLKRFREKYGRSPKAMEVNNNKGLPDSKVYRERWGTLRRAFWAAAIPWATQEWTKDRMRKGVRRFVQKYNRNPNVTDFQNSAELPASSSCEKLYGSMSNAIHDFCEHGCINNKEIKNSDRRFIKASGVLYLYRDKSPYVKSGKSIFAAIEYDADTDRLRCHECGSWDANLAGHIKLHGKMKAREYKLKHGLNLGTALISEGYRIKLIAAGISQNNDARLLRVRPAQSVISNAVKEGPHSRRHERRNARRRCKPQLLSDMKKLADSLGRTPSVKELTENKIGQGDIEFHFGSLKKAWQIIGLRPNPKYGHKFNRKMVIEIIKNFLKLKGRYPTTSDLGRDFLPSYDVFRRLFGTFTNARKAAGCPISSYRGKNQFNFYDTIGKAKK